MASEWIPCSKKLPEPYKMVLISIRRDDWKAVVIGWIDRDGQWKYDGYCLKDEVRAWMPFPKPYKEKTDDAEIY